MIEGIDHIAIAVESIDDALAMFNRVLGLEAAHREEIAGYGVEVATIPTGGTDIELVQGTAPDSPIRKFIATRGPGIHHIALAVADVAAALARLREEGVALIDEAPRPGKNGSRVAFIHPRATQKVLFELVENRRDD